MAKFHGSEYSLAPSSTWSLLKTRGGGLLMTYQLARTGIPQKDL